MSPLDGGAGAAARVLSFVPPRIATSDQDMLEHVRSALGRGLRMPQLCRPHGRKLSVAGGGPSLSETWPQLDGVVVTANAGLGFLLEKGITPWACGLLDARPHVADLIEPHPDVFYFVASTCHPRVFDKLKDCKVVLWHPSGLPGLNEFLPDGTPMICGGTTMGMRWLNLGHYMGFRKFDMHGLDSSYRGDRTHAYADSRDGKAGTISINGYVTDNNFLTQITDWFQIEESYALDADKIEVNWFGDGLLQHTVRSRADLLRNWPRRPETKALNVVCVATGDYLGRGAEYVARLKAGIEKHYSGAFKWHVITEGPESWWAKLALFEPGRFAKGERVVYFDLDTVPTGDLTDLFEYDGPFSALRDPWQAGQMNSSIMTWTAGEADHVYVNWVMEGQPTDNPLGDQAWITSQMPTAVRLQDIIPGQLFSWKAECGGGAPAGARVVYFHGEPRPHETYLWDGKFWQHQNGVRHITPRGLPWPEGEWVRDYLAGIGKDRSVVEFGCGPGRLAELFDPKRYLGLDINPLSVAEARKRNPDHAFEVVTDEPLPVSDVCLCHTVLMHVPDDEIDETIGRIRSRVVIVNEMMGREWRRDGSPPVFNREPTEYANLFAAHGYALTSATSEIYEHYGQPMGLLQFELSTKETRNG